MAGLALFAILELHLLSALLAGLIIYQLVEFGTAKLERIGIIPATGKVILVILVVMAIVTGIGLGVMALSAQLADGPESLVVALQKMADVVDSARTHMPEWVQNYLPANLAEWQAATSQWLRDNARDFSVFGKEAGKFFVHLIVGMVIGGIVALDDTPIASAPLARALGDRVTMLSRAFSNIVFSQVRISALNTSLTAIFLLIILPLTGNPLPLAKTMVAVTFIVGLLPIVGNLISNTMIFLIGLSVSPIIAVVSLSYLIIIHKLEYFINARIIGARINARSWEILISMLAMEAAFGLAGMVAAPIYYAYLKDELSSKKLI
jgi:predicted PurR-regulated permease PerM